jgi:hypothetical protein
MSLANVIHIEPPMQLRKLVMYTRYLPVSCHTLI